jgi:hypothetical protein
MVFQLTSYSFGTIQLCLQLVPVLSMLFLLTTAVGSGLWVAKLEEQRRLTEAPPDEPYEGEAPPQYLDDPV